MSDTQKRKRSAEPKDSAEPKGKRSAEPKGPMVNGVQMQGFLDEAEDLLQGETEDIKHRAESLMEMVIQHISENVGSAHESVESTAQLVNTLFEVAAAVTKLVEPTNAEEKANINKLHKHAIKGLEMINAKPYEKGEWAEDDY